MMNNNKMRKHPRNRVYFQIWGIISIKKKDNNEVANGGSGKNGENDI